MNARSNRAEVRNPVLALPSLRAISAQPQEVRALLAALLIDLQRDARRRAQKSWGARKAFVAAYWAAVAVYAGHIARPLASPAHGRSKKPRFICRLPGNSDIVVADWAEASRRYSECRERSGLGASGFPEGVVLLDHTPIARISYNGRIWPLGIWQPDMKPIYDNRYTDGPP
jgi:hypothetical protein